MFYIVFDFMMAVIMFLFGMWFYKSEGKATKFLSGYNMKSADERKKYDENAMCKAYGKRMMFMSVPFIIGIIIDIQYQGIGCWIACLHQQRITAYKKRIVECIGWKRCVVGIPDKS